MVFRCKWNNLIFLWNFGDNISQINISTFAVINVNSHSLCTNRNVYRHFFALYMLNFSNVCINITFSIQLCYVFIILFGVAWQQCMHMYEIFTWKHKILFKNMQHFPVTSKVSGFNVRNHLNISGWIKKVLISSITLIFYLREKAFLLKTHIRYKLICL